MHTKRLSVILILGLMLFGHSLFAQGKIVGTVVDSKSNDHLPAANVFIMGTNYGTATDLDGKFVISNVPVGNYRMAVRYIGYQEKIVDVAVLVDETTELAVRLDFQSVQGEVVEVTAQAEGQMAAINQQLASNTIANIVSQARIRELPDVNAAESIGRLPGVSIERSGGEATKVSIRGLSPKYNTVTVNGVRVPSTGADDRSVDLSLISSNILDGIEVTKAITPDMDADFLGGNVDLRLKEAPDRLLMSATAQTGYNDLQEDYGNYSFNANLGNRFFGGRLGIIGSFNTDEYDRSADKFSGTYRPVETLTGETEIVPSTVNLREEVVTRGRTGGSVLIDYRVPGGRIAANSFYNRLRSESLLHFNIFEVGGSPRRYVDTEVRGGTTSLFTGGVGIEQDFDWMSYDFSAARTASRGRNPNELVWRFTREGGAYDFTNGTINSQTHPSVVPTFAVNDSNFIGIQDVWVYDTRREEDETSLQLNLQLPFRLGNFLNGFFKTGGKLRWLSRMNDQEQFGRNGLFYGNSTGINAPLAALDGLVPQWGVENLVDTYFVLPISLFQTNYFRSDFLNGEYPLGPVADPDMLRLMTLALSGGTLRDAPGTEFRRNSIGSLGNDYSGDERYQAGYVMGEFNLGKHITLLPGVRYERDVSEYTGFRFREQVVGNIEGPPADLLPLNIERKNDFWLPMVHLNVNPTDWLKIRLARTETLTRPDFTQYAPISRINTFYNYMRATNSQLKPSQSTNYDAAVSVYESHLGLLTVAGFHKDIQDLIFQVNQPVHPNILRDRPDVLEFLTTNLNIPISWLTTANGSFRSIQFGVDTFINNPFEANLKGFELDWQTHFWYLPSFLRGIVLNVNYTRIVSEMEKRLFFQRDGERIIRPGPPSYTQVLVDSSRSTRLPDQPAHIANVTVGYDFKGFSARLSYLYQTDRVAFVDIRPELDNFSGAYSRWDLTVQQKLARTGIQLFANFTNLNGRADRNFRGDALINPTYIEYYGFMLDVGARYSF
jgi:TonB-dependent receptor